MSVLPLYRCLGAYQGDSAENRGLPLSRLRSLLPEGAADHCRGACVRGNHLVIFVASGVWATVLWRHKGILLAALREEFPALRDLRLRIHPPQAKIHRPPPREISAKHRSELRAMTTTVHNKKLRRVLDTLATSPPD